MQRAAVARARTVRSALVGIAMHARTSPSSEIVSSEVGAKQHEAVAAVIPGCRTIEQLEGDAAAADLELVADDHPLAVPR